MVGYPSEEGGQAGHAEAYHPEVNLKLAVFVHAHQIN
jgi:hypothetical protein